MIASEKGNLDAVRLLLSYQADPSLKDNKGDNALIKSARAGRFDVVEELLNRKVNINANGYHKKTALMAAVENGHLRVIKLLIKKGAKI
ncbi:ankyrin repeat protein, partial [Anaeromyces robustus]